MSNCQKEVEDFDTIYWNQDKKQFEFPLLCVDTRIIIYELHLMDEILGQASSILNKLTVPVQNGNYDSNLSNDIVLFHSPYA